MSFALVFAACLLSLYGVVRLKRLARSIAAVGLVYSVCWLALYLAAR